MVWVYLNELAHNDMPEFGHVLAKPGENKAGSKTYRQTCAITWSRWTTAPAHEPSSLTPAYDRLASPRPRKRGRRLMGRDPISGSLAMKKRRPMPRRRVKPYLDIVRPRRRFIDVSGDADAQHAAGVGIDE